MTHHSGETPLLHSEDVQETYDRQQFTERITGDRFATWHRQKEWRENLENGQPYFNGTGTVHDPERHSPSSLLQCHRKTMYRQLNAPEEKGDPDGIFWFGTRFEEDLVLPFLQEAVAGDDAFVSNSLWVDYTRETPAGEIRIKGSTDPAIVDTHGTPILPTEIKTKSSVENIDEPSDHHRAQLHAYLVGLNEKYDRDLSRGVLVYGARKTLNITAFEVTFDHKFWTDTVLEWATEHTQYRLGETLPPAEPEYDWECQFCSYRQRCGQGHTSYSDRGPHGLLRGFTGYPRQKLIEYLEANPGEALTPALAQAYPDLAEIYDVTSWYCETCNSQIDGRTVANAGDPLCPRCAERGDLSSLSLPDQDDWHSSLDSDSERTQS